MASRRRESGGSDEEDQKQQREYDQEEHHPAIGTLAVRTLVAPGDVALHALAAHDVIFRGQARVGALVEARDDRARDGPCHAGGAVGRQRVVAPVRLDQPTGAESLGTLDGLSAGQPFVLIRHTRGWELALSRRFPALVSDPISSHVSRMARLIWRARQRCCNRVFRAENPRT